MADPKLTIVIEQKGADGVVKSLKEIEKVGNTTFTRITKDGKLVSETMRTMSGAAQTNWQKITALSTAYMAWSSAIAGTVKWIMAAVKASAEDEASIVRRNVALQSATGYVKGMEAALDAQADSFSRNLGISDDYTREIQTQYAALGANAKSVEALTTASIGLAEVLRTDATTAAAKLTKFMEGQTNTIKGTTIAVDDNATALDRWEAVMEIARVGIDQIIEGADTGKTALERMTTASGELQEAFGGLANTDAVVGGINRVADALNDLSDWVNTEGEATMSIIGWIFRGAQALSTGGISEFFRQDKINEIRDKDRETIYKIRALQAFNRMQRAGAPEFDKTPEDEKKKIRGGGGRREPKTYEELLSGVMGDMRAPNLSYQMSSFNEVQTAVWDAFGKIIADSLEMKPAGFSLTRGIPGLSSPSVDAAMTFAFMGGMQDSRAVKPRGWTPLGGIPGLSMPGVSALDTFGAMGSMNQKPSWRTNVGNAFQNPDAINALAGSLLGGGGVRGLLGTAGSIAGNAIFPGLGGMIGGFLGGGLGKLFGGGHKKRQGETPGQPVYVEDVRMNNQLTDFLNSTKLLMLRGAGQGIDNGVRQVGLQNARAGM